jgi:hypothetical protein
LGAAFAADFVAFFALTGLRFGAGLALRVGFARFLAATFFLATVFFAAAFLMATFFAPPFGLAELFRAPAEAALARDAGFLAFFVARAAFRLAMASPSEMARLGAVSVRSTRPKLPVRYLDSSP